MSRSKSKKRGGFGTFFFGSFIGFILCLALIAGTLAFVYFKVSPNWINKTFKTDIDLGSDEINNKTVKDFVDGIMGLAQHTDTYTINNLKTDFGIEIKDELLGIDISDLKDVAVDDLAEAIEKKFGTISADELRNVNGMNLEKEMGKILNKTNTYYFNSANNKLYEKLDDKQTPVVYSEEVTFDYEISGDESKVVTKGHETSIVSGVAKIELWYLPLTVALGDFTSNLGSNMTLRELKEDYNVKLPDYILKDENLDKTINEFDDIVNDLYIADVLEYTIDKSNDKTPDKSDLDKWIVKDKSNNQVNGTLEEISKLKIGEITNNMQSTINGLYIADVLEYTIDKSNDTTADKSDSSKWIVRDKSGKQVNGVLAKIADLQIGNMSDGVQDKINTMTIAEVLNYKKVTNPTEFYYVDSNNNNTYDSGEEVVSGVMATLADATLNNVSDKILDVKIKDVLNYSYDETGKFYFEDINDNGTYNDGVDSKVTGIMLNLVDLKVSEIAGRVAELKIGDALGYYYDKDTNKFYQDSSKTPITGILSVFVDLTIQELDEATLKTQVNKLTIADVFDNTSTGILSLIPSTTKIDGVATALESVIANTNLFTLEQKGVITADIEDLNKTIASKKLGEMKLQELIDYIISVAN